MKHEKHKVALLGGGPRGRSHAQAFLANSDRFELVAVCDKDEKRLKDLGALCPGAKPYANAEAMLDENRPDVFCFVTPPQIRLEMVRLGAAHRPKAIALEKPMALSVGEARRMKALCDEAGIKMIVCHQHKYGAHWRKVKEIAESGDLGKVHTIHTTAKGWYMAYITHLIDYILFLNQGSRAKWVVGHIHGKENTEGHPSPDYAMGQVEFENGVRGIIECGCLAADQPMEQSFWMNAGSAVYGSEGYARVIVGWGWQAFTRASGGLISGQGGFDYAKDMPPYIRDLAEWLDDPQKVHPCNGDVSCHGFEIAMGICYSALERRKVTLPVETNNPDLDMPSIKRML